MQQLTDWETTQNEARDALRTDIFAQVRGRGMCFVDTNSNLVNSGLTAWGSPAAYKRYQTEIF